MFNRIKCQHRLYYFSKLLFDRNKRQTNMKRSFSVLFNYSSDIRLCSLFQNKDVPVRNDLSRFFLSRNTYKSAKSRHGKTEYEDNSDDEDEEIKTDSDGPVDKSFKTCRVTSVRIDAILKSFFGISRKKIEDSFYENKIRINGKVPLKKSRNVKEGDEIDLIIGTDDCSLNSLKIKRVVIYQVDYDPDSEKYILTAQAFKSLNIENYSGRDAWKKLDEQN